MMDSLSRKGNLETFFMSIERRAFLMAEIAVGDRDEALDLVQEAMFKLAKNYAGNPPAEWGPLFYRILQNRIKDWYRRQTIRNRFLIRPVTHDTEQHEADPIDQYQDTTKPDPATQLESEQFAPALIKALQVLPLRQQQVFLLRVWEGFDVKQTAQVMGCREGSVKTHLFRALQTLRTALMDFR